MEVKQRGSALGHRIILFIYKLMGYSFVAFLLNFVALYYVVFTQSIRDNLRSYYKHQGIELTNIVYFKHIKSFAFSIFDRFISRIHPDSLEFKRYNIEIISLLQDGGIILQSHVGSWASALHVLGKKFPPMNIVMRESTKEDINRVEESTELKNKTIVKFIDLNKGGLVANIQIANALINKELVAMMADRVVDKNQVVNVEFFGSKVGINRNPFEIASKVKKPVVAIFVINTQIKKYDLSLHQIDLDTVDKMAQSYACILESIMRKHPNQWYNFYDFFKEAVV